MDNFHKTNFNNWDDLIFYMESSNQENKINFDILEDNNDINKSMNNISIDRFGYKRNYLECCESTGNINNNNSNIYEYNKRFKYY